MHFFNCNAVEKQHHLVHRTRDLNPLSDSIFTLSLSPTAKSGIMDIEKKIENNFRG